MLWVDEVVTGEAGALNLSAESLLLQADDGLGLDDDESGPPARPDLGKKRLEQPVSILEGRPLLLPLEYGQLMPRGKIARAGCDGSR